MSVDKFGRCSSCINKEQYKGKQGVGFQITKHGNYDMQNKILKNLGAPIDGNDAVTKEYVDKNLTSKNINPLEKMEVELKLITKQFDSLNKFNKNQSIYEEELHRIILKMIFVQKLLIIFLKTPNLPFV